MDQVDSIVSSEKCYAEIILLDLNFSRKERKKKKISFMDRSICYSDIYKYCIVKENGRKEIARSFIFPRSRT